MKESIENKKNLFREPSAGRTIDYDYDYDYEHEHEHEHEQERERSSPCHRRVRENRMSPVLLSATSAE
jgi:hypothetical protein